MPITTGLQHVATMTTDLDRTVAFYQQAFEAVIIFEMDAAEDHPRMTIIDVGGGAALNIFEVDADAILGDRAKIGGRGPIDHYAFMVDAHATLELVRQRLIAAGADVGEIQRLGAGWSLFFRDVDGMELEVCCPAE
jgi:catechol 2,3-dioxygenase-like lactoylglutathione lyase family enzyme